MEKHKRPETVGFIVSAAIPVDAVGRVLKAMYDNGAAPETLKMEAIVGHNGVEIVEAHPPPEALPRPRRQPTVARAEHIRSAVLAILLDRHPTPTARQLLIREVSARLGEPITEARVTNVVSAYMKARRIATDGNGTYHLSAAGLAQARHDLQQQPPSPEPASEPGPLPPGIRPGTVAEACYRRFEAEPLRVWTKQMLKGVLDKDVRAPVRDLYALGVIKKLALGQYQFAGR